MGKRCGRRSFWQRHTLPASQAWERISSDSVLNSLNCNTQGAPLNKDTWCSKALKHQKGDAKPRVLEPGLISEAH
eukprot:1161137-Pelagomonas_calceolata.AAC.5